MFESTIRARRLIAASLMLAAAAVTGPMTTFAQDASLAQLARTGQREAVLAAITSPDIDVNAAEPDGSTALLWATYNVDHELVRALLKAGARANVTNHFGASPLGEAAKLGDADLARAAARCGRRSRLAQPGRSDPTHARRQRRRAESRGAADRARTQTSMPLKPSAARPR